MSNADTVTVDVSLSLSRPLYEVAALEADRSEHESVETWLTSLLRHRLLSVHDDDLHTNAEPIVGVSDDVAERIRLLAEARRQAGDDFPWADTVDEFVTMHPVLLDECDRDIRPEWARDDC
jgi:hypothetical protein